MTRQAQTQRNAPMPSRAPANSEQWRKNQWRGYLCACSQDVEHSVTTELNTRSCLSWLELSRGGPMAIRNQFGVILDLAHNIEREPVRGYQAARMLAYLIGQLS